MNEHVLMSIEHTKKALNINSTSPTASDWQFATTSEAIAFEGIYFRAMVALQGIYFRAMP
jgi:hypothetical protein